MSVPRSCGPGSAREGERRQPAPRKAGVSVGQPGLGTKPGVRPPGRPNRDHEARARPGPRHVRCVRAQEAAAVASLLLREGLGRQADGQRSGVAQHPAVVNRAGRVSPAGPAAAGPPGRGRRAGGRPSARARPYRCSWIRGQRDSFVAYHAASGCRSSRGAGWRSRIFRAGLPGVAADRPGGELVMVDETQPSPTAGVSARPDAVASCWMCGIRLHASQKVPGGGGSCGDIRWCCGDARACTQRWTTSRRALAASGRDQRTRGAEAGQPAGPGDQVAVVGSGASRPAGKASPRSGEEAGRLGPVPWRAAYAAGTRDSSEAERAAASGGSVQIISSGTSPSGAEDRSLTGPGFPERAHDQGSASLQCPCRCYQFP